MKLTEIEIEIAEILENNARLSNEDIAKMKNLSVEEVNDTIKRLEDLNVVIR